MILILIWLTALVITGLCYEYNEKWNEKNNRKGE